ncbi:MAG: SHOCT domain-containing protein [Thermaerobacter sp.]|nr:SHOCT domain-containing protein [Thermaerobacter sp.]
MMWGYLGGPWGWLGPISMMIFWVLVIGGIALLLRSWWTPSRAQEPDQALSILDRRYASGEISREEYQAMRQDLTGRSR